MYFSAPTQKSARSEAEVQICARCRCTFLRNFVIVHEKRKRNRGRDCNPCGFLRFSAVAKICARRKSQMEGTYLYSLKNIFWGSQYSYEPGSKSLNNNRLKSDMIDANIIVFARHPTPGRVKTRLAADIGDHGAAELYKLCAERAIRQCLT